MWATIPEILTTCQRLADGQGDGSIFLSPFTPKLEAVERNPERIFNDRGNPGCGSRLLGFIITGAGAVELTYFSQKGGTITQTVELTETPIPAPADEP